ncbi:transmembrane protein 176B-like [Mixophyes fleayi]|uniref:transmembrane protein 176B-like n=1 Tax=Mixophyes fleayi TaxID=3061075 RepID=UPI003F4E1435
MKPVSTIKTDNGNASCETPEGTVINININQRSALDGLLDTIRTVRTTKKSATDTQPSSGTTAGERLGLGVSLISLGCISVMLAVILCVVQPSLTIFYYGTYFWIGFPFIVSGALNVVSYRYPIACWKILAFIGLLVSFGVSIAGMVLTVSDIRYFWWDDISSICDKLRYGTNDYYGYRVTRPPRDYYDSDWDMSRCKNGLQSYQKLVYGLIIMSLVMMICGLCISIIGLGCRLKVFCCGRIFEKPVEEKDEPLVSPNPAGQILTI